MNNAMNSISNDPKTILDELPALSRQTSLVMREILTNGFIDDKMAEEFAKSMETIAVTIDNQDEVHDTSAVIALLLATQSAEMVSLSPKLRQANTRLMRYYDATHPVRVAYDYRPL